MNRDHAAAAVEGILADGRFPYPLNAAMAAVWILGGLKGKDLQVLDLGGGAAEEHPPLCEYYVIGSAGNPVQAKAMAEEVLLHLKHPDRPPPGRREGGTGAEWTLIDFGDLIVHIFLEKARGDYSLERPWRDARPVPIPPEYLAAPPGVPAAPPGGRDFF